MHSESFTNQGYAHS